MNDRHVAVELATEPRAVNDSDNFTRGPLKAGDVMRLTSFVPYDIGSDGRFSRVRGGSFGAATKNQAASLE